MRRAAAKARARPEGAAAVVVLVTDAIVAAAIAFLAMDGLRPGFGVEARTWLLLWAVFPRVAAEWLARPWDLFSFSPRPIMERVLPAVALLLGVFLNHRMLTAIPDASRLGGLEALFLAFCWLVGFGLRESSTYRLYEPLACLTLVSAVLRGASFALPLAGIAIFGLLFSAALRHQYKPGAAHRRRVGPGMRNARLAAVVVALLFMLVFAGTQFGLSPLLLSRRDADRSEDQPPVGDRRSAPKTGTSGAEPGGEAGKEPISDAGGARLRDWGSVAPVSLRRDAVTSDDRGGEAILKVTAGFAPRAGTDDEDWMPGPNVLWRGWSYVDFDPRRQVWLEQQPSRAVGPEGSRFVRPAAPEFGAGTTAWEVEVMAMSLDALLVPYFTLEIDLGEPTVDRPDVSTNADGDFPVARGLSIGDFYRVTLRPMRAVKAKGALDEAGEPPSPRYVDVPEPSAIGIDLRTLAGEVFADAGPRLSDKIAMLRSWVETSGLRHTRGAEASELPDSLAEFLVGTKSGDCRHFATAATLLLRAEGVPARLVTGFVSTGRDVHTDEYFVARSSAHAWVEVLSKRTWMPIDPANWAPTEDRGLGGFKAVPPDMSAPFPRPTRLLVLLLVASSFLVFLLVRWWRARKKPAKAEEESPEPNAPEPELQPIAELVPTTPTEHLLVEYGRLQDDLAGRGQERRESETPSEHAWRVSVTASDDAKVAFGSLIPLVDDGLYGMVPLTEGDLARGRHAMAAIRREYA